MKTSLKKVNVSLADFGVASRLLEQSGPAAMYDYLENFGDRYARLANGVAKGDSTAGNAALGNMEAVARELGRPLSKEQVNQIRFDMATAYLELLQQHARDGLSGSELTWKEALAFHTKVFDEHNLPPEAWTLFTPFDILSDKDNDAIWENALSAAGYAVKEVGLSLYVWDKVRIHVGVFLNENEQLLFETLGSLSSVPIEKRSKGLKWLTRNTSSKNIADAGNVSILAVGEQFAKLAALLTPDGNHDILKALFEALMPESLLFMPDVAARIDALFASAEKKTSPLILDLDGTGVHTLGLSAGVHFDHDGNGFAEQTGWVGQNAGMLVLDRNGNGVIDDGSELFGNNTLLPTGKRAVNGFAALAALDSNKDGKIDAADELFLSLRVWRDGNSDGFTNDGELLTLEQAGVASIDINYRASSLTDAEGNRHLQTGLFTRTDGTRGDVHDVWFNVDTIRSAPTELRVEDPTVSAMPDIAGVGNVHSLHQAMLRDDSGKLIALVSKFSSTADPEQQLALTSDILMAWTGADRHAKNSRGSYLADARRIYVMEAMIGRAFSQTSPNFSSPGPDATADINKGYDTLVRSMRAHLSMQTHLKPLLAHVTLDFEHGGALDVRGVLEALQAQYAQAPDQALDQLRQFTTVLQDLGSPMALAIKEALQQRGDNLGTDVMRELAVSTKAANNLSVNTETKNATDFSAQPEPLSMSELMANSAIPTTPTQSGETPPSNAFFANAANAFASAMVSYAPEASVIAGMQANKAQAFHTTLSVGHR